MSSQKEQNYSKNQENKNYSGSSQYDREKFQKDLELFLKFEELKTRSEKGYSLSEEEKVIYNEGQKIEKKFKESQQQNQAEETQIREISQKISKGISASLVMELGHKLCDHKIKDESPKFKVFYTWAEKLTELKRGSIDEYIELYEEFKGIKGIIPEWMNKSHLSLIRKLTSEGFEKPQLINFIKKLDQSKDAKKIGSLGIVV